MAKDPNDLRKDKAGINVNKKMRLTGVSLSSLSMCSEWSTRVEMTFETQMPKCCSPV